MRITNHSQTRHVVRACPSVQESSGELWQGQESSGERQEKKTTQYLWCMRDPVSVCACGRCIAGTTGCACDHCPTSGGRTGTTGCACDHCPHRATAHVYSTGDRLSPLAPPGPPCFSFFVFHPPPSPRATGAAHLPRDQKRSAQRYTLTAHLASIKVCIVEFRDLVRSQRLVRGL